MYEPISSTAHVIAHIRSFTSIPYAGAIALLSNAKEKTAAFHHRDDFDIDLDGMIKLAPWIEQRFKSLHKKALYAGSDCFVELASGLSPGGMIRTEKGGNRYLEVDLPEMIAEKKRIVGQLTDGRSNLGFAALSVLDGAALKRAVDAAYPEMEDLTFINEGLQQYLNHEENAELAGTIGNIMRERDGTWITPDFVFKRELLEGFDQSEKSRRVRQIMYENTGRDMVDLAYENEDEVQAMLGKAGLETQCYWQKGSVYKTARTSHLDRQRLWVITPKL